MHNRKISVLGLGYVGLPVAVEFAKKGDVIGFDINERRVNELNEGFDHTLEVSKEELAVVGTMFTANPDDLSKADFHILAVPTPVNEAKQPDMSLVLSASRLVAKNLKKGDIVVYESTVYPGATEDDCIPVLEEVSGLKAGVDFKVGYSPERINPGDKNNTFTKITKVVSGQDEESLNIIADVYGSVVTAGVFRAASIKVAEASKVIENTQRDINIAFMNELSLVFELMGIDTLSVLEASSTKWNFLKFTPGLVGGHCIGVDPFYLTHAAEKLGYHPEVILSGRRINDDMGKYVAGKVVDEFVKRKVNLNDVTVNLVGLTFKENCKDTRNTRVVDIFNELKRLNINVVISDPVADKEDIEKVYNHPVTKFVDLKPADALILAVSHEEIKSVAKYGLDKWMKKPNLLFDIKGCFKDYFSEENSGSQNQIKSTYWRL